MGWDVCAWASCLGGQRQDDSDEKNIQFIPVRTASIYARENGRPTISEKKIQSTDIHSRHGSRPGSPKNDIYKRPPPVPPMTASKPQEPKLVTNRDLPPLPPVPNPVPAVYELGMPTPHHGLTRSNSGRSEKSRKRRTKNFDKHRTAAAAGPADAYRDEDKRPETSGGLESDIRRTVVRPLILSIHEGDGNLEPLPDFAKRPTVLRATTFDDSPIACNDREAYEEQRTRHRRSDSAPIPLLDRTASNRSLEPRIRRKPVSPQNSVHHARVVDRTIREDSEQSQEQEEQQTGAEENPFELETPAVELSADPKSRTQSYYADAGAQMLVATLSDYSPPPPVPDMPPSLSLNTTLSSKRSNPSTPTSKRQVFTPLTTWSSPIDNPLVSPITPGTIRNRDRLTMLKRSRSLGPSSAPSRAVSMSSLNRRSFEAAPAPPLPVLPANIYNALANDSRSKVHSLSTAESTADNSRRTSSNSSASEASSRSSHPSTTPKTIHENQVPNDQPRSQSVSLNRNSAYAPIPLVPDMVSPTSRPPIPKLPPQAYTFSTPRKRQPAQSRTSELMRSISTENLRARRRSTASTKKSSAAAEDDRLNRSKSTYFPVSFWSGDLSSEGSTSFQRSGSKKKRAASGSLANEALPPLPLPPFSLPPTVSVLEPEDIPLPEDTIGDDLAGDWDVESVTTMSIAAITEYRPDSKVSIREKEIPKEEEKITRDEGYGLGLGSAYGVAY